VKKLLASRGAPWIGGTLLLLIAAAGLYLFTGATASVESKAPKAAAGDITYGPANAKLTVIEYSDFQCPFCAQYAPILASLRQKYGDQVKFVYRFFPLAGHPYATVAAKAAYAASLQGKFWEMHDLLFKNQKAWSASSDPRTYFDSYAQSLGLDLTRFHTDMEAQSTLDFIAREAAAGDKAGVSHTPWFVVGDKVVLPRNLQQFEKLIQDAL